MNTWLDWLNLVLSLVTFAVALRLDLRQSRQLDEVRRKEEEIEGKLDGKP